MASPLGVTTSRGFAFRWGERIYVMGVVNMTPDSFSGDGLGDDLAAGDYLRDNKETFFLISGRTSGQGYYPWGSHLHSPIIHTICQ